MFYFIKNRITGEPLKSNGIEEGFSLKGQKATVKKWNTREAAEKVRALYTKKGIPVRTKMKLEL